MKIEKTKNTDDEYPFIQSEKTGAGIEYGAFSGTWYMTVLAYYCYLKNIVTVLLLVHGFDWCHGQVNLL